MSGALTINEVRARRRTVEAEIAVALQRFEVDTGCVVSLVSVERDDHLAVIERIGTRGRKTAGPIAMVVISAGVED